ncbi:MAG: hypothetical protein LBD56_00525 [Endomicrobium sp.]|jgi:hypothetical protein|nr:hypothetical protein [Endomicrobium sp.]
MKFVTIKTGILPDNLSGVQIKEKLLKSEVDEVYTAKIIKIYDKLNFYKFGQRVHRKFNKCRKISDLKFISKFFQRFKDKYLSKT